MVHRSPFPGPTPADVADQAAEHLEFVIRNEVPDSIAAVLMEPIGGTSGAYPPPPGYLERVRELCDEYDVLLIADEVITGFGRCGEWFGMQTEGVEPDMLTFAKAATSAYVPLSGVLVREEMASWIREEGTHLGQTFAGHPVACAAALAALEEYRGGLIESVRRLEPVLESALVDLADRHGVIGDVRGRGLLWAVEFTDPETDEPFVHPWVSDAANPVDDVIATAEANGLLIGSGRPNVQVILAPPFCVDPDEIELAVERLEAGIEAAFE
jgi:taurine--2-oxoglutarate transaminase